MMVALDTVVTIRPVLSEEQRGRYVTERGRYVTEGSPMPTANSNDRFPSAGSKPAPPGNELTERVRHYFDRHPEVSRDEFLLKALSREIDRREQREKWNAVGLTHAKGQTSTRWSTTHRRPSPEEIRLHAWLNERLARLHRERRALWPKLGRSLTRWLGR